jgi:hypothetical protein
MKASSMSHLIGCEYARREDRDAESHAIEYIGEIIGDRQAAIVHHAGERSQEIA